MAGYIKGITISFGADTSQLNSALKKTQGTINKTQAELKQIIETWTKEHESGEIIDALLAEGCPAGPINTIEDVAHDPHIVGAREMFVDLPHPVAGDMKVTGNQIKLTNHKIVIDRPAPILGQHTEEVLHEVLGMSHEEYEKLAEAKTF